MTVGPAVSGGLAKKAFGALTKIIPFMLKKSGLPDDVAEAMGAKGNFWAGVTLGAGAALLGGGMLLGALSGGALLVPGLLGSVLLNGAVAGAAVAVGGFLLRETAKELGGNLLRRAGRVLFGKIFGFGGDGEGPYHRAPAHQHAYALAQVQGASHLARQAHLRHRFEQAKARDAAMFRAMMTVAATAPSFAPAR